MNDQNLTKYATFVLRISLGIMFIAHGLLKVLVFTLPGTAQFFEGAGFPGWLARHLNATRRYKPPKYPCMTRHTPPPPSSRRRRSR